MFTFSGNYLTFPIIQKNDLIVARKCALETLYVSRKNTAFKNRYGTGLKYLSPGHRQYACSKTEDIFSTVVTTQALLSIYRDKNIF